MQARLAALREKMPAKKVVAKKAVVKKVVSRGDGVTIEPNVQTPAAMPAAMPSVPVAKKVGSNGRVGKDKILPPVIPGTNHATVLCMCRRSDCPEYREQKMVRVPMIGGVVFLPGHVLCARCMGEMTWEANGVHVDRVPEGEN